MLKGVIDTKSQKQNKHLSITVSITLNAPLKIEGNTLKKRENLFAFHRLIKYSDISGYYTIWENKIMDSQF